MDHRMAVVVTCVDAPQLAKESIKWLMENTSDKTIVVLCDNGSKIPLPRYDSEKLIRFHTNVGGNAIFHEMLPHLEALGVEFVAYLHCDMMVRQLRWDMQVINAFDEDPFLGLCGFVGSREVDELGGRGGGTMLNYMGDFYPGFGQATTAEQHGARVSSVHPAAVLDHCAMIFRVSVLKQIPPQEGNYAPCHFYDRICCAEIINRGLHVAVVGVLCDHFSGGIAGGMDSQIELCKRWLEKEGLPYDPDYVDRAVYVESEKRYLHRFRDVTYKLVPYRVYKDYFVTHFERDKAWVEMPYEYPVV